MLSDVLKRVWIVGVAVLFMPWVGVVWAAEPLSSPADIETIYKKAFSAGDAGIVAPYYAPDAQLYPPDGSVIKGRDDIQEAIQKAFDDSERSLDKSRVSVTGDDENAVLIWDWRQKIIRRGLTSFESGRSLHVWKKDDDGWQIHQDIFQLLND